MSASVHRLPATRTSGSERPRGSTLPRALWVALGAGILVGAIVYGTGGEGRALRELPSTTRSALYARTIDNLASVCGDPTRTALREFCQAQARLALSFPECDGACVDLARTSLRQPTR